MELYKYKSVEFIEDVIENKRLFCSTFDNLNDPMEWAFTSDDDKVDIDKLINETEKGCWRICCLSRSKQHGLMWSMYGDSHRGVCIEVEVDENNIADEGAFNIDEFGNSQWIWGDIRYKSSPDDITDIKRRDITRVLWTKSKQWEHEREVRFVCHLNESETSVYFPVKVKTIYLGKRIDENKASKIEQLCKKIGISCVRMNSDNAPEINYWEV